MAIFDGNPARLWLGGVDGFQVRLFRRTFDLRTLPTRAELQIFAERRYHAWINGVYLGRGPIFHHPDQFPVDSHSAELLSNLTIGHNVLAVLVQANGHSMHNHIYNGEPGLIAQLTLEHAAGSQTIVTDDSWHVTDQSGWRAQTVRRSWAVDYVEQFDAAVAPGEWQSPDFDDKGWRRPDVHRPPTAIPTAGIASRPVPTLVAAEAHPVALLGQFTIDAPPLPAEEIKSSGVLGKSIMDATWTPIADVKLPLRDFTIDGITPQRGEIICFDLGREFVGRVILECDCPSDGIIEIGWSEVAENNRPLIVRKGVGYLDRVYAKAGKLRFEPVQFGAMRYLALVLRGFTGPVRVRKFYVLATEPGMTWPGEFASSDDRLNRIFAMCKLSHQVGTQETIMDCPSREQAAYVGDGMPVGKWMAQLTGDFSHWKYLVREQWRRQSKEGLVRSSIFSGRNDTLVDYTLIGVMGTRDYLSLSGDVETVRGVLENCRRAVGYFDGFRNADGLCTWERKSPVDSSWEHTYDPALPAFPSPERMNLFIDHPGLGWHNQHEAGIDRRGANAALNGFYVLGQRALAEMERAVGNTDAASRLEAQAAQTARAMHATFYDPTRRAFVDGFFEGKRLEQVSQQANTLAVAAGCLRDDEARELLERLVGQDDPSVANNGPYFWTYLFPEMARLGLHRLALDKARALWGRMLDGGATTLWETFEGDDLDTWCHPWSAAVQEFLQTSILGLPGADADPSSITLRPRFDLLDQASGRLFARAGWFEISWQRRGTTIELRGKVPDGVTAQLHFPGKPDMPVKGAWSAVVGA